MASAPRQVANLPVVTLRTLIFDKLNRQQALPMIILKTFAVIIVHLLGFTGHGHGHGQNQQLIQQASGWFPDVCCYKLCAVSCCSLGASKYIFISYTRIFVDLMHSYASRHRQWAQLAMLVSVAAVVHVTHQSTVSICPA